MIVKFRVKSGDLIKFSKVVTHQQQCLFMLLEIKNVDFIYKDTYEYNHNSIINIASPSKNYYTMPDLFNSKYTIDYKNSVFIGTSITINDLLYEPNQNGHRLYANPKYVSYSYEPRAKLYFRTLTPDSGSKISTTWLGDTDYYNSIHINTGPCFTPEFWNNG